MSQIEQNVLNSFFEKLEESKEIGNATVERLRELLEGDKNPKVIELVDAFDSDESDHLL